MRRGLSLYDFLISEQVRLAALPVEVSAPLDTIAIDIDQEIETPHFRRWTGTLPASDFLSGVLGTQAVGVDRLAWTFTATRATEQPAPGTVEDPSEISELRVALNGLRLELPHEWGIPLHPADEIPAHGTDMRHLRARGTRRNALIGDLWFRLRQDADGNLNFGLTGPADPFRTEMPEGAIANVRMDPPAAVFSPSADGFGLVMEAMQLDGSRTATPRQIAGGDSDWTGLRIVRAGLHLPHSVPIVGSLAVEVRNLAIPMGDTPGGLQGEVELETGKIAGSGATIAFEQADVTGPGQSLPIEWPGGHAFIVTYRRVVDDNREETPPVLTARRPAQAPGRWIVVGADGVRRDAGTAETVTIDLADITDLRFERRKGADERAAFKLLNAPDGAGPDADADERYPLPAQTYTFRPAGPAPGPLWQIDAIVGGAIDVGNAGTGDAAEAGHVVHLTGPPSLLSVVSFVVPGRADEDGPADVVWSVYADGKMPPDDDPLATRSADGPFRWDGWQADRPVSVVARFTVGAGTETSPHRTVQRRLWVSPRADGPLFVGHGVDRDDPKARILRMEGGARARLLDSTDSYGGPDQWARMPLSQIQTYPHISMKGVILNRVPGVRADGTIPVPDGQILIVPLAPDAEPAGPAPVPAKIERKRVLLVAYDRSYPLMMLNDGPAHRASPAAVAGRWMADSEPWTTAGTSGRILKIAPPPNDDTRRRAMRAAADVTYTAASRGDYPPETVAAGMLAKWIDAQDLDPADPPILFVVSHTSPEDRKSDNERLALSRRDQGRAIAQAAVAMLNGTAPAIVARAEHENPDPREPRGTADPDEASRGTGATFDALRSEQRTWPHTMARVGQLGEDDQGPGDDTTNLWIGTRRDMESPLFQIERNITFIITGTARNPDPAVPETPDPIRVVVPGPEDEPFAPQDVDPDTPDIPWRLRARAVWDAPVYTGADDLCPTLTELELTLPRSVLPGVEDEDAFSILGRVVRDGALDEVQVTLGVSATDDPGGLKTFEQSEGTSPALIAAAMFGPTLFKKEADATTSGGAPETHQGKTATAADVGVALAGGAIFASTMKDGRLVWTGAQADLTLPGVRTGFSVDYLVEGQVNVNAAITLKTTKPITVAWSGVGIDIDWRATADGGLPDLTAKGTPLDFGAARSEVLSTGLWNIGGALSKFVEVRDLAVGFGSIELSAVLVPTKPLGRVKVDRVGLAVRWDDDGVTVRLTEMGATLSIPGLVTASGALAVSDTAIRGSLDITVPPAGLSGSAAFAVVEPEPPATGPPMVHLEALIRFATPIPIGASGLALAGVAGRVVTNGERATDELRDVIGRELHWGALPTQNRYRNRKGQHAIGLGAAIGTLPDAGFSLSALGMLTLAFPEIELALTAEISIAALPKEPPAKEGDGPSVEAGILAMVVISKAGVTLAAEGRIEVPVLLKAHIPIGAHFPVNGDFFVRIGSDGGPERPDTPVTVTAYPGLVDLSGWAFVMIEEGGLHDLGGDRADGIDLHGFAVGAGVGIDLDKSFGPFALRAYADVIAGVGLDPPMIAAQLRLGGEIDFRIASVSVGAELGFEVGPDRFAIEGTVRAKISFFFFDLKASAKLSYVVGGAGALPPPPDPLREVAFTDRDDVQLATATPTEVPKVPVDAAIRLRFHPTPVIAPGAASGFALVTDGIEPNWIGSTDLRFAYRIDGIALTRTDMLGGPLTSDGRTGPLPATVVMPADGEEGEADAGRSLRIALLSDDPVPWVGNVSDDDGPAGRVLDEMVDFLCKPVEGGGDGAGRDLFGTDFAQTRRGAPWSGLSRGERTHAYRGRATIHGPAVSAALGAAGLPALAGGEYDADALHDVVHQAGGRMRPFAHVAPQTGASPGTPAGALALPRLDRGGLPALTLPTRLDLDTPLLSPELVLLVDPQAPDRAEAAAPLERRCLRSLKPRPQSRRHMRQQTGGVDYRAEEVGFWVDDVGRRESHIVFGDEGRDRLTILLSEPAAAIELSFVSEQVDVTFSNSSEVLDVLIEYLDGRGRVLGHRGIRSGADVQGLTHEATGLMGIRITPPGALRLRSVCPSYPGEAAAVLPPAIAGRDTGGRRHAWVVTRLSDKPDYAGALRYRAVPATDGLRWTGLDLGGLPHGWMAFERLSGIPLRAVLARDAEAARRAARQAGFLGRQRVDGQPAAPPGIDGAIPVIDTVPSAARPPLLVPGATYAITVRSTAATWTQTKDESEPRLTPPVDAHDAFGATPLPGAVLGAPGQTVHSFTTPPAPEAAKAAARAFRTALPREPRGRHYLDDPMAVVFGTTIVPALLAVSGATLRFELRRTDPAGGGGTIPPQAMRLIRGPGRRADWRGAMDQLQRGLANAPCILGEQVVDETMSLFAPLDADARYRLSIFADGAGDPIPFGESRFGTSRYATPDAQIAELGFGSGLPLPDRLVAAPPPPAPVVPLDAAFENAAIAWGLDPAPTTESRAVSIYAPVFGQWRLAGLHIASPEPLERNEEVFGPHGPLDAMRRLALTHGTLTAAGTTQPLRVAARDAGGARWILAPAQPLPIPPGTTIALHFAQEGYVWAPEGVLVPRPATLTVSAPLRTLPTAAEREGLT